MNLSTSCTSCCCIMEEKEALPAAFETILWLVSSCNETYNSRSASMYCCLNLSAVPLSFCMMTCDFSVYFSLSTKPLLSTCMRRGRSRVVVLPRGETPTKEPKKSSEILPAEESGGHSRLRALQAEVVVDTEATRRAGCRDDVRRDIGGGRNAAAGPGNEHASMTSAEHIEIRRMLRRPFQVLPNSFFFSLFLSLHKFHTLYRQTVQILLDRCVIKRRLIFCFFSRYF